MILVRSTAALLWFGISSAQAQFVEPGTRELFGRQSELSEQAIELRPRTYGMNQTESRNDRLFNGTFKTDPKLILGTQISPNWSVEAGYANLFERGFHRIDERDARDTAGALGINGFNTHAAVKYTLPVTDRLTAYGKLGVAYSEMGGRQNRPGETGMYTGIGARYKVNDRMTVGVEYGNTAAQSTARAIQIQTASKSKWASAFDQNCLSGAAWRLAGSIVIEGVPAVSHRPS